VIDLTTELTAWLRSTDARTLMKEIVAEAVQTEIRSALEDELIDVEGAAAILAMTEGALRKAVERGQIPCQRVGTRLRFRRSDLMRGTTATASLPRRDRPVAAKPDPAPRAASARTFVARSDRKIAS
jgi:excisionase family DNA binding protein